MKRPPMPCTPADVTWHGLRAQCLNCGASADHSFSIRHVLTSRQAEDRYVFSLGGGGARMCSLVDSKSRPI